jgi:hypothetical protein
MVLPVSPVSFGPHARDAQTSTATTPVVTVHFGIISNLRFGVDAGR